MAPESTSSLYDLLWAPLRVGMGSRIGLVGDSGCGKTTMARALLAAWLQRAPRGFALVHDDTGPAAQFVGQERAFVSDLKEKPLAPSPRVAVFRGGNRRGVDPESIASLAWRCSENVNHTPTLVLLDELERSAIGGQWRHGAGCPVLQRGKRATDCTCELPKMFSWGRRSNLSVIWTTQSPQSAPRAAFEQSSALLCVHLGGRGLRYLRELDYTEGESETYIAKQPDALDVARGAIPSYVLLRRGATWDRRLYKI